jgi:hypothetical protein
MLGHDFLTLKPVELSLTEDGPHFLIASANSGAGKTTTLKTWVLSLAEKFAPTILQFIFIDFHCRTWAPFRQLPHTKEFVKAQYFLESVISDLHKEISTRAQEVAGAYEADPDSFDTQSFLSRWPHITVVIDDYDIFAIQDTTNSRRHLAEIFSLGKDFGISTIVAGDISALPPDYDDSLIRRTRKSGCGILLAGVDGIDQFNNAHRPVGESGSGFPPGRGYLIKKGRVQKIQPAVYWQAGEEAASALERRISRVVSYDVK